MISIDVFADFDFLSDSVKVGVLSYDRVRGVAMYTFEYDALFLSLSRKYILSSDLMSVLGKQIVSGDIFRCLRDSLPDRWGRALIDKREKIVAKEQLRQARTFYDFDYLVQLDDRTRSGAFRLQYKGQLISNSEKFRVPILTDLGGVIAASKQYETALNNSRQPDDMWIKNLFANGSSLGGARPKANVLDAEGNLYIAKIPSVKDTYDVALWEHFASRLATEAGIKSAETNVLKIGPTDYHTLLSKRFDRKDGKRVHYASSITLAGLSDGDGAGNGKGYLDIVDAMVGNAGVIETEKNLKELYRRVAFNICIGNHDDHFRNHGFLLTKDGWTLSPAFDINPTDRMEQSLLIDKNTSESSLEILLDAAECYMIERIDAQQIIYEVKRAMVHWRPVALHSGISESEQERFAERFCRCFNHVFNVNPDLFPNAPYTVTDIRSNNMQLTGLSLVNSNGDKQRWTVRDIVGKFDLLVPTDDGSLCRFNIITGENSRLKRFSQRETTSESVKKGLSKR